MWRCKKERNITQNLECKSFKPSWTWRKHLPEIELMMDEIEAINLADVEWFDMKLSAEKMWISAPTFCRILANARKKIWTAIINWYSIKICDCSNNN